MPCLWIENEAVNHRSAVKVDDTTIVIIKGLPVLQCESCSEYLLDDSVMKRTEEILDKVDSSAELEIIRYAA